MPEEANASGGRGGGEEAFYLPTGKAYKERRKLDS